MVGDALYILKRLVTEVFKTHAVWLDVILSSIYTHDCSIHHNVCTYSYIGVVKTV